MSKLFVPEWLHDLPDGLYGDVDIFIESLEAGIQKSKYLEYTKFWRNMPDWEFRSRLLGSIIPGCT
jgi:hypothetical protein